MYLYSNSSLISKATTILYGEITRFFTDVQMLLNHVPVTIFYVANMFVNAIPPKNLAKISEFTILFEYKVNTVVWLGWYPGRWVGVEGCWVDTQAVA